jgi:hypothetical protein
MTANVVELGPHSKMSPTEVLELAKREDFHDVVIVGYDSEGKIKIRSSQMTRAEAFYLLEQGKQSALGR